MPCASRRASAIPHLLQHIKRRQLRVACLEATWTSYTRFASTRPPIQPRLKPQGFSSYPPVVSQRQKNVPDPEPRQDDGGKPPHVERPKPLWLRIIWRVAQAILISSGVIFLWDHVPISIRAIHGPSMKPILNPDCQDRHDKTSPPTWALIELGTGNLIGRRMRGAQKAAAAGEDFVVDNSGTASIIAGRFQRGDIVITTKPHDYRYMAAKRVVAVAGDIVTPIPGSIAAQHTNELVIPFNHLWLEGDVGDLQESLDSNTYGPVTEGLVFGKIVKIWRPWWKFWSLYDPLDYTPRDATQAFRGKYQWPARREGRVRENAVMSQTQDADARLQAPSDAHFERTLRYLRDAPEMTLDRWDVAGKDRAKILLEWQRLGALARTYEDPAVRQKANEVVKEFEKIIGADELRAEAEVQATLERAKWTRRINRPEEAERESKLFSEVNKVEDPRDQARKDRLSPAAAALKEMQEKTRAMIEEAEIEYKIRDKEKELRESQAGMVWPAGVRREKSVSS